MSNLSLAISGVSLDAVTLLGAEAAVKAAVVLAIAWAVNRAVFRRSSSAMRHTTWMVAVVAAVALPVLMAYVPRWGLLPNLSAAGAGTGDIAAVMIEPLDYEGLSAVGVVEGPSAGAVLDAASGNGLPVVLLVWMVGSVLLLLPLVAGRVSLYLLMRSARPVEDTAAIGLLDGAKRKLGVNAAIRLWRTPCRSIPLVWSAPFSGRAVVLVPEESDGWSAGRWEAVLMHELAHLKRGDHVAQLAAAAARSLYWFNPLVYIAAYRMMIERERACDDLVLGTGCEPAEYASHLVAVAAVARRVLPGGVLAMARAGSLEDRVGCILDPKRVRRPNSGVRWLLFAAAAVLVPVVSAVAVSDMTGDSVRVWNAGPIVIAQADARDGGDREPVPATDGDAGITDENEVVILIYDLNDLVNDVRHEMPMRGAMTGNQTMSVDLLMRQVADLVRDTVEPDSWRERGGERGRLTVDGATLIVAQTADNHRDIRSLMEQLRQVRRIEHRIHARLMKMNRHTAMAIPGGWTLPADDGTPPRFVTAIADAQALEHIEREMAAGRISQVLEPVLEFKNGHGALVKQGREIRYIGDYETSEREDGVLAYTPVALTIEDGIKIEFRATVSADLNRVTIEVVPQFTAVSRLRSVSQELPDALPLVQYSGGGNTVLVPLPMNEDGTQGRHRVTISSPEVATTRYEDLIVSMPNDAWIMIQLANAPQLSEDEVYVLAVTGRVIVPDDGE